ncbi:MAG: RNA 2',3'-cyclic phosphodiesterase [Planctomycetota bacterium]
MRLFVAFVPSREAVDHLAESLETLRNSPPWSSLPGIRWVPPERWHVTLAFLGEVNERIIPQITLALHNAAQQHALLQSLQLHGLGRFPSVLWVGLQPTARFSPTARLARSVQRAVRQAGVPIERRPWRAHLTVARLRGLPSADALPALPTYCGPTWSVQTLQLIQSVTGPDPSYRLIDQCNLAASVVSHPPRPGD